MIKVHNVKGCLLMSISCWNCVVMEMTVWKLLKVNTDDIPFSYIKPYIQAFVILYYVLIKICVVPTL